MCAYSVVDYDCFFSVVLVICLLFETLIHGAQARAHMHTLFDGFDRVLSRMHAYRDDSGKRFYVRHMNNFRILVLHSFSDQQ